MPFAMRSRRHSNVDGNSAPDSFSRRLILTRHGDGRPREMNMTRFRFPLRLSLFVALLLIGCRSETGDKPGDANGNAGGPPTSAPSTGRSYVGPFNAVSMLSASASSFSDRTAALRDARLLVSSREHTRTSCADIPSSRAT